LVANAAGSSVVTIREIHHWVKLKFGSFLRHAASVSRGIVMLRSTSTIAAFLAGFAPLDQAAAASSGNEFLAHVVGHLYPRGESFACFTRQYDAAHLAAHPRQQVIFAKALVDAHFRDSSLPGGYSGYMYQVSLAFRFRSRKEADGGTQEPRQAEIRQTCSVIGEPRRTKQ
jgi:hypothetical protein